MKKSKSTLISIGLIAIALLFIVARCSPKVFLNSYTVARDPRWESVNLSDKETSILAFSDELISAISSEEDITINTVSSTTNNLFRGLDNEDYDGILTPLIPTAQERSKYLLSDSYFLLGPVLIVKENSTVTSIEQMENKDVGILRGSSVVFDIEKYPSILLIVFDDPIQALDALAKGNIDGMIMDIIPAYTYTHIFYQTQLKIATEPLTKKGLRLITRRDQRSSELYEAFNRGLKKMKENGKYDELLQKWGLFNPEKTSTVVQ